MNVYKQIGLMLGCIAVIMVWSLRPIYADANKDSRIGVELAPSATTIVQGEPITLHYKITNVGDARIGTRFGKNYDQWYTLSLTGSNKVSDLPPTPQSIGLTDVPFMDAGDTREGDIVVTRRLSPSVGQQTLKVHVNLPYVVPSADIESRFALKSLLEQTDTVYTQDFTFSLAVLPPDSAKLTATAEQLRQSVLQEQNGQKKQAIADALFSMPDTQAAASWAALATDPNQEGVVTRELRCLPSPKAADILADMAWHTASPDTNFGSPYMALEEMYNVSEATLQDHIRQVFAKHGVALPDKIVLPQAMD